VRIQNAASGIPELENAYLEMAGRLEEAERRLNELTRLVEELWDEHKRHADRRFGRL